MYEITSLYNLDAFQLFSMWIERSDKRRRQMDMRYKISTLFVFQNRFKLCRGDSSHSIDKSEKKKQPTNQSDLSNANKMKKIGVFAFKIYTRIPCHLAPNEK